MSPRCRRCPPVLLALLVGMARSGGSQECQDQDVTVGGSLCLVPEKPQWEWREIHWRVKPDLGSQLRILTATRNGNVKYSNSSFLGRAELTPGNLSLCISPVNKAESGVYTAEFEKSSGHSLIFSRCFRVSVWDPIPEPSLQSEIVERDRGWCLLSLLCSSPENVSISWECPEHPKPTEFPEFPEFPKSTEPPKSSEPPKSQSQRFQWIPEDAEPQICLCNLSNPGGWRTTPTLLTCTGILGNFWLWAALGAGLILILILVLVLVFGVWRRRRRKENSREDPPGAPAGPPESLTLYAEVGARNAPSKDDGATVYTAVTPRTLEHPRHREQPGSVTVYATVQRPSSMKRKRLERALVSTAYLEDNRDYGKFGVPKS